MGLQREATARRLHLATLQILLHWGKKGELLYSAERAPALRSALVAFGANDLAADVDAELKRRVWRKSLRVWWR